ncbi:hypothetical protein PVAG01_01418 [Phlyctema vagabunda]|uniref:Uncharacterized protein n=1 Tax=Phlyctema vagabunda TaxID=108571 RepID=A0ABR4PX17_9HELO
MNSTSTFKKGFESSSDQLDNAEVSEGLLKRHLEHVWLLMGRGDLQEPDARLALDELEQLFVRSIELSTQIYTTAEIHELRDKTMRKVDARGHFIFCVAYNSNILGQKARSTVKFHTCICKSRAYSRTEAKFLEQQVSQAKWVVQAAFMERNRNDKCVWKNFTGSNVSEACSEQQFFHYVRRYTQYAADALEDGLVSELARLQEKPSRLFMDIMRVYREEQSSPASAGKQAESSHSKGVKGSTLTDLLQECGFEAYVKYRTGPMNIPSLNTRRSRQNLRGEWEDIHSFEKDRARNLVDRADFKALAGLWYEDYERLKHASILAPLRSAIWGAMVKYRNKWFTKFQLVSGPDGKLQPQYELSSMAQWGLGLSSKEVQEGWTLLDD